MGLQTNQTQTEAWAGRACKSHRPAFLFSSKAKKAVTMPPNLNPDYYYGTNAGQYSFLRIPRLTAPAISVFFS
jgi:hypothetical protein